MFLMLHEVLASRIEALFSQPGMSVWDMRVNPQHENDIAGANGMLAASGLEAQ